MHELAICREIARIVDANRTEGGVRAVDLQIGMARQVVPQTLADLWELVTADGPLAGSVLRVEHVPVRLRCRSCGSVTDMKELSFRCAGCGGGDVEVISGEELLVVAIEVDGGDPPSPA